MPVAVRFEWDCANDVCIVYPVGAVRTEADCQALKRAFDEQFGFSDFRLDLIVVVDMFAIDPQMVPTWQQYRRGLLSYARYCVRIESGSDVLAGSPTKAVPAHELMRGAPTIAAAMRLLEAYRAQPAAA